ncbi:hypothetical protein LguiB_027283 [Lonicera macranthoides]
MELYCHITLLLRSENESPSVAPFAIEKYTNIPHILTNLVLKSLYELVITDKKDERIQELTIELQVKKRLSAAYREQLITVMKDLECQNEYLSSKLQVVSSNLKDLAAKPRVRDINSMLMLMQKTERCRFKFKISLKHSNLLAGEDRVAIPSPDSPLLSFLLLERNPSPNLSRRPPSTPSQRLSPVPNPMYPSQPPSQPQSRHSLTDARYNRTRILFD